MAMSLLILDRRADMRARLSLGLALLLHVAMFAQRCDGQRVHSVFIADTTTGIAKWCYEDVTAMHSLLTINLARRDLCCDDMLLDDETQLTAQGLIKHIRDFRVRPQDTIFYYFSGHGGYNDRDGQFLILPNGEHVSREAIRKAIEAKGVRLGVLITDCCYSPVPGKKAVPPVAAPEPTTSPLLRSLLLESKGFVDIISGSPGEVSMCMDEDEYSSMFTSSLVEVMSERMQQPATWKDVFLDAKDRTMRTFEMKYPRGVPNDNGGVQMSQRPFAFSLNVLRLGCHSEANSGGGVRVTKLEQGHPGEAAGLRKDDIILEVNGEPVNTRELFNGWIFSSPDDATILIERAGVQQRIDVRLR